MDSITKELLRLGLNPSYRGFGSIRECIQLLMKAGLSMYQLTLSHDIYPAVAQLENRNPDRIEYNIRVCLSDAFKSPNAALREEFEFWFNRTNGPASNKAFLYTVAECLRAAKAGEDG